MTILIILVIIILVLLIYKYSPTPRNESPNNQIFTERSDNNKLDTMSESDGVYDENNLDSWWNDFPDSKQYYLLGKKRYIEHFGDLVGTPLKVVRHNIMKIYNDYSTSDYDDSFSANISIERLGKTYRFWEMYFYGGEDTIYTNPGKEGQKKLFRRTVCQSVKIITDEELIDFFGNYENEVSLISEYETRLPELKQRKKSINEMFGKSFKDKYYDEDSKNWKDFDINGVFMRTRGLMINNKSPIPHYVWKLIAGNPFDRVYRNCRDYMKWKGTKRVAKLVFDNVCMWENGKIFREGEPDSEFEYPLWINWNTVGKNLLSMKTKLKKEKLGGLTWLKDDVGGYIKSRISYYENFGENSQYFISDDLINKYNDL